MPNDSRCRLTDCARRSPSTRSSIRRRAISSQQPSNKVPWSWLCLANCRVLSSTAVSASSHSLYIKSETDILGRGMFCSPGNYAPPSQWIAMGTGTGSTRRHFPYRRGSDAPRHGASGASPSFLRFSSRFARAAVKNRSMLTALSPSRAKAKTVHGYLRRRVGSVWVECGTEK